MSFLLAPHRAALLSRRLGRWLLRQPHESQDDYELRIGMLDREPAPR